MPPAAAKAGGATASRQFLVQEGSPTPFGASLSRSEVERTYARVTGLLLMGDAECMLFLASKSPVLVAPFTLQNVTNFAVFSSAATEVRLCLSTPDDHKQGKITWEIPLDPLSNKTGDTWHIGIADLSSDLLYGQSGVVWGHAQRDERVACCAGKHKVA